MQDKGVIVIPKRRKTGTTVYEGPRPDPWDIAVVTEPFLAWPNGIYVKRITNRALTFALLETQTTDTRVHWCISKTPLDIRLIVTDRSSSGE